MQRILRALYPLLSLLSQLIVALVLGLAAIPSFFFLRWTWDQLGSSLDTVWGAVVFCLALGFAFFLFGNSLLVVIILARNLFRIRNREQRSSIFSLAAMGNALFNLLTHVASLYYLPLLNSNYFNVWFYRGMGAKIGKGTIVSTHRLWDCDLIEIGENCLIGSNSSIAAHFIQGTRGRLRKVHIGNFVTIGANTSVMPGVVIDDGVIVGANSLVPQGMHLESGGVYLGVPVQRVN